MRRDIVAAIFALCLAGPAWADAGNSAAATLSCPAGEEPARTGTPLAGGDALIPVVVASIHPAEESAAATIAWCLEATVPAGARQAQIWRDPATPDATRATVGSVGYEVRAVREAVPAALLKEVPTATIYEMLLVQGDKLQIVGFFDGPPPIDAMLSFFVHDRFGVYADIDLKTHKVVVYRPF